MVPEDSPVAVWESLRGLLPGQACLSGRPLCLVKQHVGAKGLGTSQGAFGPPALGDDGFVSGGAPSGGRHRQPFAHQAPGRPLAISLAPSCFGSGCLGPGEDTG